MYREVDGFDIKENRPANDMCYHIVLLYNKASAATYNLIFVTIETYLHVLHSSQ